MGDQSNKPVFVNAKNDRLLSDQGFDEFETNVLRIARRFFHSFAVPESQAWHKAFFEAERMFPAPFGATIATAVLAVIDELRVARKSSFVFISGACQSCEKRVTQEERYLIAAVHNIRRRNRSQAHANAMMLCEGHDPSDFLMAIGRLGIITGENDEDFLKTLVA